MIKTPPQRPLLDPDRATRSAALTRRTFLRASAGLAASAAFPIGCALPAPRTHAAIIPPFLHGIASGDPTLKGVVLWTRITPPPGAPQEIPVRFDLALDPGMSRIVESGEVQTNAGLDHIVKLAAQSLSPDTYYYYRFNALGQASPIGRTRTLPDGPVERLRFAVASCSNYSEGHFNAYASIARRSDLDAVLHLGDYIYEHATAPATGPPGHAPVPDRETVALDDYRARYAQYRSDPDLQEMHRQHPMIAVWDDHEFADNAWMGGAANHQPETEGDWEARKRAAFRAYQEWMPIRSPRSSATVERAIRWGDLAVMIMLDTRIAGRDKQAAGYDDHATMADPNRSLLGDKQHAWLERGLEFAAEDGFPWRVIGQQVMMGQLALPGGGANPDAWDGYRASRDRFLAHLEAKSISDVVVLSGDIHSSWAQDLARDPFDEARYDPSTGRGSLAVEFVAPAISSAPLGRSTVAREAYLHADRERPHLRYVDIDQRGYTLLDLDRERAQAEWYYERDLSVPVADEVFGRALATERGTNRVVEVGAASKAKVAPPDRAPL